MKRISNEPGVEAGARNVGRFFLSAIALVMAIAASICLGLLVSVHKFKHQFEQEKHELSQQERSAVYVGAGARPKSKMAVELVQTSCFQVLRADIDTRKGDWPNDDTMVYSLVLYASRKCVEPYRGAGYAEYHWQILSPNATIIKAGYTNSCPAPGVGESAECTFSIPIDDRTDRFRVWAE